MVRVRLVQTRRRSRVVTIESPKDVLDLLDREARGLDREYLWRLDLDARNTVLALEVVSVGTATASLVHPREFFRAALLTGACGVVAVHNHPSLDPAPSPEDRATTKRLKEAGALLGIPLIDHVVMGGARFYSFREAGLL